LFEAGDVGNEGVVLGSADELLGDAVDLEGFDADAVAEDEVGGGDALEDGPEGGLDGVPVPGVGDSPRRSS
jgi:hypothetical protein